MLVKHLLILLNPLFFIKNTSQLLDSMELCWLKDKMIQISLSLSVKMHYLKNKTINSWRPSWYWIVTQMLGRVWNLLWIHLQGGYTTEFPAQFQNGTFAAELSRSIYKSDVKIMNKKTPQQRVSAVISVFCSRRRHKTHSILKEWRMAW